MAGEAFLKSIELTFQNAVEKFDHLDQDVGLEEGLVRQILFNNSTYLVRFGVRLRGQMHTFTGYRSVHSEHFVHIVVFACALQKTL